MSVDHNSERTPAAGGRLKRQSSVRPVVVAADPQDQIWESELLSLLCSLETLRTRLQEHCEAAQAVAALDTMIAMVKTLSDFVAGRLPRQSEETSSELGEATRELEDRIAAFHGLSGRLRNRLCRSPWQQFLRLFGSAPEEGDPRVQFAAVTRSLYEVLASAFDLLMGLFRSLAAARDWNEARQAFLADLQGLVELLDS